MNSVLAENQRIRRTLGDLVALSALPVRGPGCEPRPLADALIEVALHAIMPDFIMLRVHDPAGAAPIDIARFAEHVREEQLHQISLDLAPLLNSTSADIVERALDGLDGGRARVIAVPFGLEGEAGVLVAGAADPNFPTEEDRLLLNVALNHAAMILLHRRDEEANRLKDEILATVSHELRAPLSAMLLWSQMLENGLIHADEMPQTYRSIRQSAQAQQQLIEDLLDISRLLAGQMRINLQATDLHSIARAAAAIVRPLAVARNIRIDEELDLDVSVQADAGRIQQVVLNLLNNAVKFSQDGGHVHVGLRRGNGTAEIEVTDGGQGISAEFLPHVFKRFRQAPGSNTPRHGGLGLGLAIARELVELHGGDIRAQSPGTGLGATFTVKLPTDQLREASSDTASPPPAQAQWRFDPSDIFLGVRILLVEDDPTTRQAIQYLLQECQAEVSAFDCSVQALGEFARHLDAGPRFDVLLSDIGLPEMNGNDLIRKIREMERHANALLPIPAVALSAYAREEDRVAALAAGFNVHLTKPVVAASMVRTVAKCVVRPFNEGPSGRDRNLPV